MARTSHLTLWFLPRVSRGKGRKVCLGALPYELLKSLCHRSIGWASTAAASGAREEPRPAFRWCADTLQLDCGPVEGYCDEWSCRKWGSGVQIKGQRKSRLVIQANRFRLKEAPQQAASRLVEEYGLAERAAARWSAATPLAKRTLQGSGRIPKRSAAPPSSAAHPPAPRRA
jgi:hypothetical protein